MTESELAKALLELDTAEFENVTTTAELTRRVLQKDKRRVRVTAWVTAICWIGALCTLYWNGLSLLFKHAEVLKGTAENVDPVVADLVRAVFVTQASIEGVIFALLCTLLLLFFSRRATLRQVNSNLMEISAQLRNMKSGGE